MSATLRRVKMIDSHTAGEPTRVVLSGGPDLGGGTLADRLIRFGNSFDAFRSAIVNEPRGFDAMVGALLCPPVDPTCAAGVIFFNNVGYLGMCGHGTIGVIATLAHLGKVVPGSHRIETPVGIVTATLHSDQRVSVENVASFRKARNVSVNLVDGTKVTGDVAWGGNWFYLVENHGQQLIPSNIKHLTSFAQSIRRAMNERGFPEVDHIELLGPPIGSDADARNFVLCPGGAYDRSPCGTGTSAKLACLAADGKLAEGDPWRQESIIGSRFVGRFRREGDRIIPTITGRAYICAESTLLLDEQDPFCWGIGATACQSTS